METFLFLQAKNFLSPNDRISFNLNFSIGHVFSIGNILRRPMSRVSKILSTIFAMARGRKPILGIGLLSRSHVYTLGLMQYHNLSTFYCEMGGN